VSALPKALAHWGQPGFETTLKDELKALDHRLLPLQDAVTEGGIVEAMAIDASILSSQQDNDFITIRASIFFNELVPSCSCGDEPVSKPVCCHLSIRIHRRSAAARFELCG
jgi:hypothetical protein